MGHPCQYYNMFFLMYVCMFTGGYPWKMNQRAGFDSVIFAFLDGDKKPGMFPCRVLTLRIYPLYICINRSNRLWKTGHIHIFIYSGDFT